MSIVSPLPYNIQDGQAIDAVPLMANLNQIVSDVNANAALVGGSASQQFLVATTANPAGAVPLAQAQAQFAALNGSGSQNFAAATLTASEFVGPGTGLTGTAAGLSIGGNAATANAGPGNTPFALRNRIINGDMRVAQRGTSFTSPVSGSYTLDRWMIAWSGAAPASVAQVAGPAGFEYACQITGSASNTNTQFVQRIESGSVADLVGESVTIQVNLAASVAQNVTWNLLYATAQDNFSSVTQIVAGQWSVGTSAATYTATIANLPAGAANGLQLVLQPNGGGAFTSGTIDITGVQLEAGPVATPFERRPIGMELALCQRYFQSYTGLQCSTNWSGNDISSASSLTFPRMRVTPSATVSGQVYTYCTGFYFYPQDAQSGQQHTGGNTSGYVASCVYNLQLPAEL